MGCGVFSISVETNDRDVSLFQTGTEVVILKKIIRFLRPEFYRLVEYFNYTIYLTIAVHFFMQRYGTGHPRAQVLQDLWLLSSRVFVV